MVCATSLLRARRQFQVASLEFRVLMKLETRNQKLETIQLMSVPGGHTGGAPPVPIPNTEVKPSKADATAAARQWESRTLPGYKQKAYW